MQNITKARLALVCGKEEGTEFLWSLASLFPGLDWSFQLFTTPGAFLKDFPRSYDLLILDECFCNDRVFSLMEEMAPELFVFILASGKSVKRKSEGMIFCSLLEKKILPAEIEQHRDLISLVLNQKSVYVLEKRGFRLPLKYRDIQYLEKKERKVVFHTVHGTYDKSMNLSRVSSLFDGAGFIAVHASFLVNPRFIEHIGVDFLQIAGNRIPVSRAGKKKLIRAVS